MKNAFKLFGIIVLVSVIGFAMTACSNGTTGGPGGSTYTPPLQDVTYVSYDEATGNKYELVITEAAKTAKAIRAAYNPKNGDTYILTITNISGYVIGKSTGSVTVDSAAGSSVTLTLVSKGNVEISVTVSSSGNDGKIDVIKADNGIPNELEGSEPTIQAPTKLTETPVAPEDLPDEYRWFKWIANDATATLVYTVAADGVCTITIGGTAQPNNATDGWGRWKANVWYRYTAKANTAYTYVFEAWTESGTRKFPLQYYWDDTAVGIYRNLTITNKRETYTIKGERLPKGGLRDLSFQTADQLGTFYVKVLEIFEYEYTPEPEYELNEDGTGYIVSDAGNVRAGDVVIPETYNDKPVTKIGDSAFFQTIITSVSIPASVTSIGGGAFGQCPNITSVTFAPGSKLETIGGWAFQLNVNLTDITIPAGVKTIGYGSFTNCTSLKSINIPASVTEIEGEAFVRSTSLKINVDSGNPYYSSENGVLYNKDKTELISWPSASGSVVIPDGVKIIYGRAFSGCTSLTSVTIPSTVEEIGNGAFVGCTGITSIEIPSSVTFIDHGAFDAWTSSQTIYIKGHANRQSTIDAGWNDNWDTGGGNATIVYQP